MNDLLPIVLIIFGVWLGLLTLVSILTIRQIALLTLKFSGGIDQNYEAAPTPTSMPAFWLDNDGFEVGTDVPLEVVRKLPQLERGKTFLLLLSGTCTPCHKVAEAITKHHFDASIVALVPGPDDLANIIIELLPPEIHVVRNPDAVSIAQALELRSTPFAMAIEDGVIARKSYLHRPTDFIPFVESTVQFSNSISNSAVASSPV